MPISDWVIACSLDVQLFQRNSVIKIMALVHKQFAAPRFRDMWKYSWFKAGYLDARPPEFLNPVDYCFGNRSRLEKCIHCDQPEFIMCSFARYSFVSLTFGTGLMVMVTGVLMDLYTEAKARITILVSIKPFFVLFRRAGVPNLKVGNRN